VQANNYIFTTEGHPIAIGHSALLKPPKAVPSSHDDPSTVSTQDRSTLKLAHTATGAKMGWRIDSTGQLENREQDRLIETIADDSSAAVQRRGGPRRRSRQHQNPLQPSALDRRICPELVQASFSHALYLTTYMLLYCSSNID